MYKLVIQISILLSIFSANLCGAETIVRFSIQQGITTAETIDLKLYDTDKPITVSNFMSYVEDGSYNNSFMHRSVPGFVIQGGGFKYDPSISSVVDGFSGVITKAAIENEPGISNLRGTIAMAKLDGDANSATSQWFFNLDDNSADLDQLNGGFTVFGEVINNGMQIIDSISLITIYDMGCMPIYGCLAEVPLHDYIGGEVLIDTLVKITKVEGLLKISSDYNFGFVELSTYQQSEFIIENISTQNLSIGNIGNNDSIMPPFGINDTECNNTVLLPGASCVFIVSFNPVDIKVFSDSFNIEFPVLGFDYTVNVSGVSEPGYDFEGDGVSDLIENSGPNNGDGNYDGILDSSQSNVVSLPDSKGQYITLTGADDIRYQDVHLVDPSLLPPAPENVAVSMGVLQFTVSGFILVENVKVGMILPPSISPSSYYVFSPEAADAEADWFEFSLDADSITGAKIQTGASLITDEGSAVSGTFITLYLANAARGDSDFKIDNEIKVTGALYTPPQDASGRLDITELCFLLLIIAACRLIYRNRKNHIILSLP